MPLKIKAVLKGDKMAIRKIRKFTKSLGGDPEVIVGFGTSYAWDVHERTEADAARRASGRAGESKFLEKAMNNHRKGYARVIAADTKSFMEKGHPHALGAALYSKGLEVDGDAVVLTPVLTGRLRASHFVAPPQGVASEREPVRPKDVK